MLQCKPFTNSCVAALGWWRMRAAKCAEVLETSLPSRAHGLGNNPEPMSDCGASNIASSNNSPFCVIPQAGKVPENSSHPETKQAWRVLHDDVTWSYFANQTGVLAPEARARTVKAITAGGVCDTDILTGKASTNDICCPSVEFERLDIFMPRNLRPVHSQHGACGWVDLAEGDGLESTRALQPQAEAANAAEKVEDGKQSRFFPSSGH